MDFAFNKTTLKTMVIVIVTLLAIQVVSGAVPQLAGFKANLGLN